MLDSYSTIVINSGIGCQEMALHEHGIALLYGTIMLVHVLPTSASMVLHHTVGRKRIAFMDSWDGTKPPASSEVPTKRVLLYPALTEPIESNGQSEQTNTTLDLSHPGEAMRTTLDQVQQQAGNAVDQVKTQAGEAVEQLKNQAGNAVDQVKTQTHDQLDNQMTQAGVSLGTVADAVNTLSDQLRRGNQKLLASYADQAAGHVDQMGTYLRQSDPNKVLSDIQDFARREPALFLAGAFAIGLMGTRFLKSSSSPKDHSQG